MKTGREVRYNDQMCDYSGCFTCTNLIRRGWSKAHEKGDLFYFIFYFIYNRL
ncbi:hypothetical protein GCM10007140_35300 [Priestia taiwanensis]|uniref:Uncharacterized protein n=1 Tax=Priestia taiwanensis TaxID=1347902 RepID=A0A917ESC5_9BACI|nr:hypothetical protein GCM10007140_35300 [Priestia taiwanensis]